MRRVNSAVSLLVGLLAVTVGLIVMTSPGTGTPAAPLPSEPAGVTLGSAAAAAATNTAIWLVPTLAVQPAITGDAPSGRECRDGSYSTATGSGACSHHGGVRR